MKIHRSTLYHVESELYSFPETKKEILRLRAEILHASPEPNRIGGGRGNMPSNPTVSIVTALMTDRRLEYLQRTAEAVEAVYGGLTQEKQKLVTLKYWTKPQTLNWEGIALKINVSRRQALRWRDEIVYAISQRLGWK